MPDSKLKYHLDGATLDAQRLTPVRARMAGGVVPAHYFHFHARARDNAGLPTHTNMPRRRAVRALKHGSLWIYRLSLYLLLAGVLLVAAGVLGVRYWLLPNIDQYSPQISAAISRAAHQRIVIGAIRGDWDGLRPRLELQDVVLYDSDGRERLALTSVDSTLSWTSLLALEPRFYSIELTGLSFEVRRDASGALLIAGIPLDGGRGDSGLADWLLRQHRIELRDSQLTWIDETLGGVPLQLRQVQIEVTRLFRRTRFGLRAAPPMEVASPIDLRGDLDGGTLRDLGQWKGRLYLQVGYADLAALRQWVRLPMQIDRGAGGLRVWIDVRGGAAGAITADVGLSGVLTRLGAGLPELALERLQGRLGWQTRPGYLEFSAKALSFTTPDGLRLAPTDVRYARSGAEGDPHALYEVECNELDVAAVTRLVDRLPVDETLRARLADLNPRGTVRRVRVGWRGSVKDTGEYTVNAEFEQLAVQTWGYVPGFAAVSGILAADQHGGTLTLRAGASTVDMPKVFVDPLPLEALNADVAWSMATGYPLVRVESLTFSNAHLDGHFSGSYEVEAQGPGRIDLSGGLSRVEGKQVWRYVPLAVHPSVRDWLQAAIVSGEGRDLRLTLKGELKDFPFNDGNGVLEATARFQGGTLAYAHQWPRLDDLAGQISVRGHRLSVQLDTGRVLGAHISSATAVVPDVGDHEPLVRIQGEGDGSTADLLRFIAVSPIDQRLGGFTHGLQTSGNGHLSVSLEVPLKHSIDTQVSGRYRFANNVLVGSAGLPRLEQLGGVLSFTRDDVNIREGSVRVLGMPARFTLDQKPGAGVIVRGTGRADMATLRQEFGLPWMARVTGTTDWSAMVTLGGGNYDLVVESNLQGVSSALPVPLSKAPGKTLPLRLERKPRGTDQDLVVFALSNVLSGQLAYDRADPSRVVQGELRLGIEAPAPARDGLWLAGHLDYLDVDRWFAVLGKTQAGDQGGLAGVNLHVARLFGFSRTWSDVLMEARRLKNTWQASIAGTEAMGTLTWTPGGRGSLTARFSRLFVPAAAPVLEDVTPADTDRDLPSLDVVADDFRIGERQFGRLVLEAVPDRTDWRIDTLNLDSPEGRLSMTGVWQAWTASPTTQMDIHAQVADVGGYFVRLKLPEGIKGGSGSLEGKLSWAGPPFALDLPTLNGSVTVKAKNGQFVRVEPGIGKLIGVLSLQGLPRRMSLDFRDIFSQGFRFDDIHASAVVQRGVVHTDNFRMNGTSARVDIKGDLDLARETQTLDVRVIPSLSESVALGAAIVNPAIGLATLFAQKALKDPINQMVSVEYAVTGTWTDPIVANKRREPANSGKQGRQ